MSTMEFVQDIVNNPEFAKYHIDHPTCQQVIEREGLVSKLTDKVMLITGASSGIGIYTAAALFHTGAHVFLAVRDTAQGEKVKRDIESDGKEGKGKLDVLHLNLESLDSVRQCAAAFLTHSKQLHVLVCNAGVMGTAAGQKTKEGFDMQFGVNHVAHFLLFQLLKDALLTSSTPQFNSRVVVVGSSAHRRSPVRFDDLNMDKEPFDTFVAYGQSKTANAYMALELDRRYGSRGLHSTVVHPGGIPTNLGRHVDIAIVRRILENVEQLRSMKSFDQGGATTVWAAVSKEWEGKGGKYLEDCAVAQPAQTPPLPLNGYLPHIYDAEAAKRLWTESLRIVGVKDDSSGGQ